MGINGTQAPTAPKEVLISSYSFSSEATKTFNLSGYPFYKVRVYGTTGGANGITGVRFNADTGNNYQFEHILNNAAVALSAASSMFRLTNQGGATRGFFVEFIVNRVRVGGKLLALGNSHGQAEGQQFLAGIHTAAADLTSMTIFDYDGTNAAIKVDIYGIKNTA